MIRELRVYDLGENNWMVVDLSNETAASRMCDGEALHVVCAAILNEHKRPPFTSSIDQEIEKIKRGKHPGAHDIAARTILQELRDELRQHPYF